MQSHFSTYCQQISWLAIASHFYNFQEIKKKSPCFIQTLEHTGQAHQIDLIKDPHFYKVEENDFLIHTALLSGVHCKESSVSRPLGSATLLMLGPHWNSSWLTCC